MLRWLIAAAEPEPVSLTTIITSAISALALILVPVATALAATWRNNKGLSSPVPPAVPPEPPAAPASPPLPPAVRMSTDPMMVAVDVPDAFLDVPLTVTILNKILGEQVVKTYELQSKLDREREARIKAEEEARVAKAENVMFRQMIGGGRANG